MNLTPIRTAAGIAALLSLTALTSVAKPVAKPAAKPVARQAVVDDEEISRRLAKAIDAILKSTVPDSVIEQFDVGVEGYEDQFVSARQSKEPIEADSMPLVSNYQTNPELPVPIDSAMPRGGSRIVYYKGDFFSEAFYARAYGDGSDLEALKRTLDSQPWIEWLPAAQSYKINESGASRRLLEHLSSGGKQTISLYRGTLAREARLVQMSRAIKAKSVDKLKQALKDIKDSVQPATKLEKFATSATLPKADSDWVKLRSSFYEALSADLGASMGAGGLFVSTSKEKAERFSKGREPIVIVYEVPVATLKALNESGKLYAGIEGEIELNVIGPEGLQALVDSSTKVELVKKNGGDIWAGDNHKHPVWRD